MLPFDQRVAFALFAVATVTLGVRGFYRLYLRIKQGRDDRDPRTDHPAKRLWYAIRTTLTQERVFRRRLVPTVFHAFIFYTFILYLLVNTVDAVEGYYPLHARRWPVLGPLYGFLTDSFSILALVGVIALATRRFLLPSRRVFSFNSRTLLHPDVCNGYIQRDSLIVSAFILLHVGSRIIANAAKLCLEGTDGAQPFASFVSHAFQSHSAENWRVLGYWGALGSALLFLAYFPYSKHIHLLAAPLKYFWRREANSGQLPAMDIDVEDGTAEIGAATLKDLGWPRLLDAYACIQCNRCQEVCPASQTGKALSPAALEINKRMALNTIATEVNPLSLWGKSSFETGKSEGANLLQAVISAEAVWACTTCGACMEVCPTQNEQMLDIVDIRRNLVMQQGEFPKQLQAVFRSMERTKNPWGLAPEKRMDWAESLKIPTVEEVPNPDVLYWIGCAGSYDPGAQKTARATVQLLQLAGVKFAVLGKRECCTGDPARRAGNELLYQELARTNIETLNSVRPKVVIASCPHCVNILGSEYPQVGGNYTVTHHSEYLASLVEQGKLTATALDASVTFHDPCYLGRHRGSYEQPRSLLNILSNHYVELDRSRSNAFCCGAGGAQFWKEEEPGEERVSENRFREVQTTLGSAEGEKVLAVGCPFCKSMLQSTPSAAEREDIVIKDVAELLLEGVRSAVAKDEDGALSESLASATQQPVPLPVAEVERASPDSYAERALDNSAIYNKTSPSEPAAMHTERKKWSPQPFRENTSAPLQQTDIEQIADPSTTRADIVEQAGRSARKKWNPGAKQ